MEFSIADADAPMDPQNVISTLPDEIFSRIFELAVEEFEYKLGANWESDETWNELGALLLAISTASRRWRSVTLSSPRLWRNVRYGGDERGIIRDGVWTTEPVVRYFPFDLCLRRCRAVPINLKIQEPSGHNNVIYHLSATPGLYRIRSLILCWGDARDLRRLLTVDCTSIHTIWLDWFEDVLLQDYVSFLQHCPNMISLRMSKSLFLLDAVALEQIVPVSLSQLRNLELVCEQKAQMEVVFQLLTPSSLERLLISLEGGSLEASLTLKCPPHSLDTVRELLLGGRVSMSDALNIMAHTPSVEVFGLFKLLGHSDLRHRLPWHPVLPRVRTVLLDGVYFEPGKLTELIDKGRSDGTGVLTSIGLAADIMWPATRANRPPDLEFSESEYEGLCHRVKVFRWEPPIIATYFSR